MSIVLNGTTGITTPDINTTAQSTDIISTGDIEAVDATLSGGIYLGGTGAANKLDDYEEGTFTPFFYGSSITYVHQNGTYTKIGNMVAFQLSVKISAITPTSNFSIIGGLPFTSINHGGGNPYTPVSTQTNGFDWTGSTNTMITFQIRPGSTDLQATTSGDNTNFADINSNGLSAGDWVQCAGVYFASS